MPVGARIRTLALLAGLCVFAAGSAATATAYAGPPVTIGSAVKWDEIQNDATYRQTFLANFQTLTPEYELKMADIEPQQNQFSFSYSDALVNWALANNKLVHGHTLVWGSYLPAWVTDSRWTRTRLAAVMRNHVQTEVAHFKGRIHEWDVVNEAYADDGTLKQTIWARVIGSNYIALAFRYARAADPTARLCYNDYNAEVAGPHADAVYGLVKNLKAQGLIDCVGMQMHINLPGYSEQALRTNWQRFSDLGVSVLVSEMDVNTTGFAGSVQQTQAAQTDAYRQAALACRDVQCGRFTTWGFSDASSWLGAAAAALPFDANYQAKPAWPALTSTLGSTGSVAH